MPLQQSKIQTAELPTHYSGTSKGGQIPGNSPGIGPDFVPFLPGCDTLELGKTPWSSSHQQGETHETLSVYHRCATRVLPPADQSLASRITCPAPVHRLLLRASRTAPACPALPASHPERHSPQKWLADR